MKMNKVSVSQLQDILSLKVLIDVIEITDIVKLHSHCTERKELSGWVGGQLDIYLFNFSHLYFILG